MRLIKPKDSRLGKSFKRRLTKIVYKYLRPVLEALKIGHLSKPFAVGNKIGNREFLEVFDFKNGFFVEIGGFDGFLGSPTYYLEKIRGWHGVLVEPIPDYFQTCKATRQSSRVFQAACVGFNHDEDHIDLIIGSHSTRVESISDSTPERQEWLRGFSKNRAEEDRIARIKAVPISFLLDEYFAIEKTKAIDLLVLDVEGFELEVLLGLDFQKYRPKNVLVECQTSDAFEEILQFLSTQKYSFSRKYSHHDYLFEDKVFV
jgi:FkbM family methyltransferase